jgi:ATP-binding protein involved in chromosome partitioning
MDPRPVVIKKRLEKVGSIIAVAGGKGGVGKSSVASMLSLALTNKGYRVGLLDLDIHGPSDHLILGAENLFPKEEKGVIPPEIHGISFMSMNYYSGRRPSPLRGRGLTNSIIELLAITRWGDLDYLVVDLPPGLGDTTLDVIRFIPRAEFLIVYNPSRLVTETVRKLMEILQESHIRITGTIENMGEGKEKLSPYLGSIKFDKNFEKSLGSKEKLLRTGFFKDVNKILSSLEGKRRRSG